MGNPFDNPTTIRDPKDFVGREDLLRRLFGLIEKKQSVSLVGAKRIGKTSLLNYLKDTAVQKTFDFAGEKVLFLYFDLQDRLLKTQKDLFEDLNLVLRQQSQTRLPRAFSEKDDEFDFYLQDFEERGLHPVLILDTFDEIVQYAPIETTILNYLRGVAIAGHISYITASVHPLGEIFRKHLVLNRMISPFFNIFSTIRLRPFSREEARHLLSEYSTREHRPFTEKEIAWVLQMAGHHPYLLQHVGAALFEEKQTKETGKVNYQRVQQEAYQNLENHFEDCWSMFDEREAEQMLAEIEREDHEGQHAELSLSALFRAYVRGNRPEESLEVKEEAAVESTSAIELNIEVFTSLLDKARTGDQRVLGESLLIRLPAIAAQLKYRNAQTPVARGLIVRESLKNALEQMRGHGSHKDDGPDWLFYNMLLYRYFNTSRMTHNLIADRLGISTRQYFRTRKQAIQVLWQILLEMKESSPSEKVV